MSRLTTLVLAGLALLGVTSCSSYRVREHETIVRFVPEDDVAYVLEVDCGIEATSDDASIAQAVDALRSAASGRRRYPAEGGLFSVDFDDPENFVTPDGVGAAEYREVAAAVSVEASGLYLDDRGRLSFYRLTRIDRCGRLLELVTAWIRRQGASAEEDAQTFVPSFPYFDEASWKMARASLEAGHRWLSIEGDCLVLDLPMTEANAASCLRYLATEERVRSNEQLFQLFGQLTGVEISGGHARLRFFGPERRVMRFEGRDDDASYDDAVKKRLQELAVKLGGPDAPDQARAIVEGPRAPDPK